MKYYCCLVLFFVIVSCTRNNDENKLFVEAQIDTFLIDSVKVDLPSTKVRFVSYLDKEDRLNICNNMKSFILCYNVENNNLKREIYRKDSSEIISNDYYINDSILIFKTSKNLVLETFDEQVSEINLDSISNANRVFIQNLEYWPIQYTNNRISLFQYTKEYGFSDPGFFKYPIEANLYIDKYKKFKSYKATPVRYDKRFQENYYGFIMNAFRGVINDSISIYSSKIDPNLYLYNRNSNKVDTFSIKSNYHTDISDISYENRDDAVKKIEHLEVSPTYEAIIFDKFRKLYYRFYNHAQEKVNPDGTFNSYGDKQYSLLIFDENFNKKNEILLPKHMYSISNTFVGKKGLYLPRSHYKYKKLKNNEVTYDIFVFE